jgi:hypothetical protein
MDYNSELFRDDRDTELFSLLLERRLLTREAAKKLVEERLPPFASLVHAISLTIGDTNTGLTGSQIGRIFTLLRLDDPEPKMTKWKRLRTVLDRAQMERSGGVVLMFVCLALGEAKYCSVGGLPQYQRWRAAINEALSASGYTVDAEGRLDVSKRPIAVRVPTIHDDPCGWNTLFDLWRQANEDLLEATFDFSRCGRLDHNAVAFLGGLARLVEHRHGAVVFDWQSLDPHVGLGLARNGFRAMFGDSTEADPGLTIPYREDKTASDAAIMTYLKRQWLGRGWMNISDDLRDAVVSRVWEVYANAFEHGGSPIGVFTCGEHYSGQGLLKLTVVDFGTGVPANVRNFQDKPALPAHMAMNWAFQPGHTTKVGSIGRGLGLDLLREFISLNKGCLEVFSHDGYARIEESGETYETRGNLFEGTILNISLRCDDSYYCFTPEQPSSPLF